VNVKAWSPEMLELYKATWKEVAAEESAKNPFFKKVWEDLTAFRADYATWADRAFLK